MRPAADLHRDLIRRLVPLDPDGRPERFSDDTQWAPALDGFTAGLEPGRVATNCVSYAIAYHRTRHGEPTPAQARTVDGYERERLFAPRDPGLAGEWQGPARMQREIGAQFRELAPAGPAPLTRARFRRALADAEQHAKRVPPVGGNQHATGYLAVTYPHGQGGHVIILAYDNGPDVPLGRRGVRYLDVGPDGVWRELPGRPQFVPGGIAALDLMATDGHGRDMPLPRRRPGHVNQARPAGAPDPGAPDPVLREAAGLLRDAARTAGVQVRDEVWPAGHPILSLAVEGRTLDVLVTIGPLGRHGAAGVSAVPGSDRYIVRLNVALPARPARAAALTEALTAVLEHAASGPGELRAVLGRGPQRRPVLIQARQFPAQVRPGAMPATEQAAVASLESVAVQADLTDAAEPGEVVAAFQRAHQRLLAMHEALAAEARHRGLAVDDEPVGSIRPSGDPGAPATEARRRMHDAAIDLIADLHQRLGAGGAADPARFAQAAYLLFQAAPDPVTTDAARTFLVVAADFVLAEPLIVPPDADVQARTRPQSGTPAGPGFVEWFTGRLAR